MSVIKIKRAYEVKATSDGFRILVDRLWPRGLRKEDADVDVWLKEIAPSDVLRKWFNHEPEKWEEFRKRYIAELKESPSLKELLAFETKHSAITLVYGAKDEQRNQAVVLKEYLETI